MTTQQSNTKLTMPIKDTIILDSKKCNAELLTIHSDGRITVAEHLKPTETAAKVLRIMRETWMDDIQATKIREQEEHTKRLEEAGNAMAAWLSNPSNLGGGLSMASQWRKAREAKL